MLTKMLRFMKNELGGKYAVPYKAGGSVIADPSELLDDAIIEINTKPTTETERAANAERDAKLMDIGAIDMEEFRRRQGIFDGAAMDKGRIHDALFFHPDVVQAAAQVIAQQLVPPAPPLPAEPQMPAGVPAGNGATPMQPFDSPQGMNGVGDQRLIVGPQQEAQRRAEQLYPAGAPA